jgi:hypothetical protein
VESSAGDRETMRLLNEEGRSALIGREKSLATRKPSKGWTREIREPREKVIIAVGGSWIQWRGMRRGVEKAIRVMDNRGGVERRRCFNESRKSQRPEGLEGALWWRALPPFNRPAPLPYQLPPRSPDACRGDRETRPNKLLFLILFGAWLELFIFHELHDRFPKV